MEVAQRLKCVSEIMNRFTVSFLFLCFVITNNAHADNVGLAVVATGKYIEFVKPLIESAEKYFCKNHNVTYYVFTDREFDSQDNVVCVPYALSPQYNKWPFTTMLRYEAYYNNREYFEGEDYIFAIDADMLFVDDVGDEILSDHTAVMHPGYVGKKGTYEENPNSTACVYPNEAQYYFCGGVYGGSNERFFHICETTLSNIYNDLSRGIIAVWHDESHWNRYCIDYRPAVVLTPSYCFPDEGNYGNYHKRILALTKRNVQEYRKN